MSEGLERVGKALEGRYAIERELGRGGMATVYLAADPRHDRQVAIKVLHPEITLAIGSERFEREIKLAAKLQHPHILGLIDSGQADDLLYYVMPFVQGESLRDRLQREGQLPIEDAIQIALEVADALGYAHSHAIVHRDIKPENILLSGGHALVADFGIARAATEAGGHKLTQTGMTLGTPVYMAPEQAAGEVVGSTADLYSLGCVLYEMLAGEPPFTAKSPQALMARHSMEAVPSVRIVRSTVPEEVEDAIFAAMAKVPADRPKDAAHFAELLGLPLGSTASRRAAIRHTASRRVPTAAHRAFAEEASAWWRRPVVIVAGALAVGGLAFAGWRLWARGPSAPGLALGGLDPSHVAVLYFDDLSRDSSLGHVADGLTEGLINQLSQVRALAVVSPNGVRPFHAAAVPRDSIARALQVGSLIHGSIEPVGSRLSVTVRLVDGNSGADLERASLDLPAGQLLAVADSVVQEVAGLLRRRLGEEVELRERRAGTSSVEAWTLVQRAERLRKEAEATLRRDDTPGALRTLAQADSVLAAAEVVDPAWTEPVLLRGWVARQRAGLGSGFEAAAWIDSGLAHAARAVRLAPNDPAVLSLRGTLRYSKWLRRVVTDPAQQNRLLEDAKADLETATRADPLLAAGNLTLSHLLYQVDDVPGSLLRARQAYEEDAYLSNADWALDRLFWGSIDLEQFSEARRWCSTGAERFPQDRRFASCQLWLMVTPAVQPAVDQAWGLLEKLERTTPAPARAYAVAEGLLLVGGVLGRAGLADSARHVMLRARAMGSHDVDPHQDLLAREAYVRTLVGDHEEAIDLLKRYVAANPGHPFAEQAGTVWWWRELRSHPRWTEVAQRGR